MLSFPRPPDVPAAQIASGLVPMRYQDIAQDGRLLPRTATAAIGAVVWRSLLAEHPVTTAMREHGVFAILSRVVVTSGQSPLAVRGPLTAEGRYQLAHSVGADGEPDRLFLNVWADLFAPRARTHGPPPERAGETGLVARVFAEHIFSRIFAPPGERRVRRLDVVPGLPAVPPDRYEWEPSDRALGVPEDATPLETGPRPDAAPIVFGLAHTDSNQHVNSLVYPRLFEDAALRRVAELGRPTADALATFVDMRYRKPCFAGDRMRIDLEAFELGGRAGAVGGFVPVHSPVGAAVPHTSVRLWFGGGEGT